MIAALTGCFRFTDDEKDELVRPSSSEIISYSPHYFEWIVNPEPCQQQIAETIPNTFCRNVIAIIVAYVQNRDGVENVFGPEHWKHYLGITIAPHRFSEDVEGTWQNIRGTLQKDERVFAIYRPAQVQDQALTAKALEKLVSSRSEMWNKLKITFFDYNETFNECSVARDSWVLIVFNIIANQVPANFDNQQSLHHCFFLQQMKNPAVTRLTASGWSPPSIDHAIILFYTHFIRTGKRLFETTSGVFGTYCLGGIKRNSPITVRFNQEQSLIVNRVRARTEVLPLKSPTEAGLAMTRIFTGTLCIPCIPIQSGENSKK